MKAILSWLAGCSDCSYSPREEVSLALLFPKHLSGLRTENNDHSTVFTYVINLHLRINSTMPILHFIFFKNIRKIKNKKKIYFERPILFQNFRKWTLLQRRTLAGKQKKFT